MEEESVERAANEALRTASPEAHALARAFHEHYERLAPLFGYTTRPASRTEWEQVPLRNRALMVFAAAHVIEQFDLKIKVP